MTFAHWLALVFPLGFAGGVGYRVAQWAPGAFRRWLDQCRSCGYLYGDRSARPWRYCSACREAGR